MKSSKTFLSVFLVTVFLILGLIAGINYYLDDTYLVQGVPFYRSLIRQWKEGQFLGGVLNFDQQRFKEALIAERADIQTLLIGSSTIMPIGGETFKNDHVLNAWVGQNNLEESLGILGSYFFYHQQFPARVVWSIDPWVFQKRRGDYSSEDTLKPYRDYLTSLINQGKQPVLLNVLTRSLLYSICQMDAHFPVHKLGSLISWGVLNKNIDNWQHKRLKKEFKFFESAEPLEHSNLYYPDGSVIPYSSYALGKGENYKDLPPFEEFDEQRFEKFRQAVSFLISQKVDVVIYLPPLHPLFYKNMVQAGRREDLELEERIRAYAQKTGVQVFGGYNGALFNFMEDDYYERYHLRPGPLNQFFKKLGILSWDR